MMHTHTQNSRVNIFTVVSQGLGFNYTVLTRNKYCKGEYSKYNKKRISDNTAGVPQTHLKVVRSDGSRILRMVLQAVGWR